MTQSAPATAEVKSGVAPYLSPSDAAAAAEFYKRAFGAEEVARVTAEDGKRLMHVHLYINGGSLMMSDCFAEYGHAPQTPAGFNMHLQVDDIDAWFKRAVDAGAEVTMPVEDMFWGDRYGQLKDPFGYTWALGQTIKT